MSAHVRVNLALALGTATRTCARHCYSALLLSTATPTGSAAVGGTGCLRGGGSVAHMLLPLLLLLTRFKRLCVLVCRYTHRLLKVSVMRLDREAVCVVCCVS